MTARPPVVHVPVIPGQVPLCHAFGCGCWLAIDDDGSIRPEWVTCGNCLRILKARRRAHG